MIKCTPPPAPLAAPTRQKLLVRHSSCATRSPLAPPGAPSLKIEYAVVAELVDALDSGSSGFTAVGVRVSPTAPPKALVIPGVFAYLGIVSSAEVSVDGFDPPPNPPPEGEGGDGG